MLDTLWANCWTRCGLIAGHVGPDLNDCGNENKMQLTSTCTKPSGEFFEFFLQNIKNVCNFSADLAFSNSKLLFFSLVFARPTQRTYIMTCPSFYELSVFFWLISPCFFLSVFCVSISHLIFRMKTSAVSKCRCVLYPCSVFFFCRVSTFPLFFSTKISLHKLTNAR